MEPPVTCFSSLAAASPNPAAREAAASLDAQLAAARRYSREVVAPAALGLFAAAHDWLRDVAIPAASEFSEKTLLPAGAAAAAWTRDVALPAAENAYVVTRDVLVPRLVAAASAALAPAATGSGAPEPPDDADPDTDQDAVAAAGGGRYTPPAVAAVTAE